MVDIHAELNEYKKEFIYLRDFLNDVFKVVDADISDVITWILKKIKQAGITLYTVNEFKEVEFYCDPFQNEYDFDVLCRKLDTVRNRGCLPGERDESGLMVSGYWEDAGFEAMGFRRDEIFAIFPDVLNALTKLEGADSSENDEAQGSDIEQKELRTDDDFLSRIAMLEKENESLMERVNQLEKERPILLRAYRDDDPLYLAIEIRNREWANYNPNNDMATRGNQEAIKKELQERGFSSRQAESIELVACPIKR
ncbi:hypothetical protein VX361_003138 [Salmonella enterica]|uniref:Uncharacterized protein n=1 Tax=Salmonella typhimurium (strain SL1344) TaxID=216597 RepID=A0A719DJ98_SALTS|nr:hypothetical protein [Salmonella enterica subsp. enterica serovar Onderstepoort]EDE7119146.1 hypothetical protein [Salmonella enterica subsp. enterica serovar Hvittingfoss]EDH3335764.1 hypothetical protein [Salmonella enterica]EDK9786986.1 hypothetical protein [Salmonella enterica subsp. enterica serovar Give]HAD6862634.1 hypothetical protein [Salmonella enterica subsp. enterica serovar Typhimurium str. SL1344]